ncbi:MAG: S1C family serine protease [Burkholderiales bacterium]
MRLPGMMSRGPAPLRRRLAVALCAGAALAGAPGITRALEPDKIFEKVAPSVWTVRALDAQERLVSQGSAVVIGPGRLITNCHVLRQSRSIQIRQDNVIYVATLEFPDAERDLCQLSVRNFTAPALVVAPAGTLKVGQRVYAIGSPQGLELTLSDGLISSLRGDETGGARLIQTSAAISPGSSGGGLFDTEGRLIGITSFQRREAQNLNFAVPAEWIAEVPVRGQAALDKRREAATTAVATAPATASTTPATTATAPGEFPRKITGEAFTKFFQVNRSLNGVSAGGQPLRLQLYGSYVDGFTEPSNNPSTGSGIAASARGGQQIRAGSNQICFRFNTSPNGFWLGQTGCYQLVQLSANEYRLQPDQDGTDFTFSLR